LFKRKATFHVESGFLFENRNVTCPEVICLDENNVCPSLAVVAF